jgi:tetratricopeptide (TPR) repeat protein
MRIKSHDKDFALTMRWKMGDMRRYVSSSLFLFVILILIYANSFDCSWHFDDYINIVENPGIQIKTLSWQEIERSVYGIAGIARWQRPVSYFTFAMNYYFDGLNVFWYHVVNFFIHYITSVFLFLFIYNTLKLPILEGRYEQNAYSIALLATLFWAINPVQVMAVTYIVQRMASMAAMFYIMAMYFYLKGRSADKTWKSVGFFVLAAFWGILSIGSKENAAMLPLSLFLFDLFLIQGVTIDHIRKNWTVCLFALVLVPAIGLMYYDFSMITGDYDQFRPFTMWERVLTQPRVILFYISLLFYPITSRMMLIHDVEISKSLFDPWTTLAAVIVLLLILVVALLISRKRPLISYCIIFFFLNHLIEGSFISLELVYEHRNYLPSMLLFVPLSIFIVYALSYFEKRKRMIVVLSSAITAIIIIMGVSVFIQNNILKDEISLWSDNIEKTPRLHHVRQNLGVAYFIDGRVSEAFVELTKALDSLSAAHIKAKVKTHGLLGEYYILRGNDKKAMSHYFEALKIEPYFYPVYNRLAEIKARENQLSDAEKLIRIGIALVPDSYAFHLTLARILLKQGSPDQAIKVAQKALMLGGDSSKPYVIFSEAFTMKKDHRTAYHFYKLANSLQVPDSSCESDKQLLTFHTGA